VGCARGLALRLRARVLGADGLAGNSRWRRSRSLTAVVSLVPRCLGLRTHPSRVQALAACRSIPAGHGKRMNLRRCQIRAHILVDALVVHARCHELDEDRR
jgi:hypothetical protein